MMAQFIYDNENLFYEKKIFIFLKKNFNFFQFFWHPSHTKRFFCTFWPQIIYFYILGGQHVYLTPKKILFLSIFFFDLCNLKNRLPNFFPAYWKHLIQDTSSYCLQPLFKRIKIFFENYGKISEKSYFLVFAFWWNKIIFEMLTIYNIFVNFLNHQCHQHCCIFEKKTIFLFN